jgi:hypothetical protein
VANLDMAVLILDAECQIDSLISKCLRHRCHRVVLPVSLEEHRPKIESSGLSCDTYGDGSETIPALKGNTAFLCTDATVLSGLDAHFKKTGNHVFRG